MTEDGLLNAENLTSYNLTHTILIQIKDNGFYNIIGAIIRSQKPKPQMITGSYINKSWLLITELNLRTWGYKVETS